MFSLFSEINFFFLLWRINLIATVGLVFGRQAENAGRAELHGVLFEVGEILKFLIFEFNFNYF
jgi:hypothetical protein